ncbi:UDP-N-acetylglucosamine 2-epimerase [soil metagenome]
MAGRGARRTILVCTGTRAEFGLLRPVMRAIAARRGLRLRVAVLGAHLLGPARTVREVEAEFEIAARVPMQRGGNAGSAGRQSLRTQRLEDARALGRGVSGCAAVLEEINPDCVVVLGDRIEALAAALAASVGGVPVAHIHGGDRAEGIADEAMRHALTKLAHLHFAASAASARRIIAMGEARGTVFNVGSPALDGLMEIEAMGDEEAAALGDPRAVVLLHPSGLEMGAEAALTRSVLTAVKRAGVRMLALMPNSDAGREEIAGVLKRAGSEGAVQVEHHLERARFIALLKRLAQPDAEGRRGFLIGNSSAGLIEGSALRVPVINAGPRQGGRERGGNVIDVAAGGTISARELGRAIERAVRMRPRAKTPYGKGDSGERIAAILERAALSVRKRNTY